MDAFGGEQILDAERDALQRAALALREPRVRGLGHVARLVGGDDDIGVELRIGALDRREIGLGELGRGDLLGAQLGAGSAIVSREVGQCRLMQATGSFRKTPNKPESG